MTNCNQGNDSILHRIEPLNSNKVFENRESSNDTVIKIDTSIIDEDAVNTPISGEDFSKKPTARKSKSKRHSKLSANTFSVRRDVITKTVLRQLRKFFSLNFKAYFDYTKCGIAGVVEKRVEFNKQACNYLNTILDTPVSKKMGDLLI